MSNAPIKVTHLEAMNNYYFRLGDEDHVFEAGQRKVPGWEGMAEEEVLVQRVAQRLKPVASIVDVDGRVDLNQLVDDGHTVTVGTNEWGVRVVLITTQPDATLMDLLEQRDPEEQRSVDNWTRSTVGQRELTRRRVSRYMVCGGFDVSSRKYPVNVLESALLYGYPLALASETSQPMWDEWT